MAKAIPRHFLRTHEREFVGEMIIDLERPRNRNSSSVLDSIYYVPSPKQKAWLTYLHRRHVLRLRDDP
jgi:hypothetical protein